MLQHREGLNQLAVYYQSKQAIAINLTRRIQKLILRVLRKEKELRGEMEARHDAERKLIQGTMHDSVNVLKHACTLPFSEGSTFQLDKLTHISGNLRLQQNAQSLWHFLSRTAWKPAAAGTNGAIWVELLAMFHALGGRLHIPGYDCGSPHAKQPSLSLVLQTFATQLKGVLNLHASPEVRDLFGPARASSHRLSSLAFAQHLPCTRVEMCSGARLADQQFSLLLQLHGTVSQKDDEKLNSGTLRKNKTKLNKRQKLPWASIQGNLTSFSAALEVEPLDNASAAGEDCTRTSSTDCSSSSPPECGALTVACPVCSCRRSCTKSLTLGLGWNTLLCHFCQKASKASIWFCTCAMYWRDCDLHRPMGLALCSGPKPPAPPVPLPVPRWLVGARAVGPPATFAPPQAVSIRSRF